MSDRGDNRVRGEGPESGDATLPGDTRIAAQGHLDTDALSACIDDRLDGDLREIAERHLAACGDCRRELVELRATVDLLRGLPQYRPRRSFALGPEFAHPVRTSRLARLLPMLPTLRAAAAACLLLLVTVGAGDVLTQIGDESGDQNAPASFQENVGDTAFNEDDAGQTGANAESAAEFGGAPAPGGDGTGGQVVGDTSETSNPDTERMDAGDGAIGAASDERATSAEDQADSMMEAPAAPVSGESANDSAASSDNEALGEAAGESDAETGDGSSASSVATADNAAVATATAPPDSSSRSTGRSSAAMPPPSVDEEAEEGPTAAAVPTIGISTEPVESEPADSIAQAETSDPVAEAQRASATAEQGISNWRLIEIVLGVLLLVLGGLIVVLHRLRDRARRTGFIR